MLSRRLLKVVIVLFNQKQGMSTGEIIREMGLSKLESKTDELCNETTTTQR